MKNVLITGANSYIGVAFENYVHEHYSSIIHIDTIDMIDGSWKNKDFSSYDVVYHVAGIAHVDIGKVNDNLRQKYYEVNTNLAIETAKKAKAEGVTQFVFMSSIIVYGEAASYHKEKKITAETEPHPNNFYGESKLQAEKSIRNLSDNNFTITILRPPMVYGKGCKGNYQVLSKLAKKLLLFPNIKNERSMIYIENLCEFLCQVIIRHEGGIFFPQNAEYTETSEMVKIIAEVLNHNIYVSKVCNWAVGLARLFPGKLRKVVDKAFGNLCYDKSLSKYSFNYQIINLNDSIKRTEK